MSKKLEEIRQKIDALDNQIHDLLMRRAELIVDVSEEKRKSKLQIIQPAREAMMIRRLLARHEGKLPRAAIVRIWRELVGAVSLLQTGLKVAVYAPESKGNLWDMARDYFGSVLPMIHVATPLAAIGMVREREVTFAVLPWPVEGEENPWWLYLAGDGEDPMRVVVRLPYGDVVGNVPDPENRAVIVARINFEQTGDDRSFLAIEAGQGVSRGRIVELARKAGLKALSMYSRRHATGAALDAPALHLIEVEGYVAADDQRIETLLSKFDDPQARIVCIGGYACPPVYESIQELIGGAQKETASMAGKRR